MTSRDTPSDRKPGRKSATRRRFAAKAGTVRARRGKPRPVASRKPAEGPARPPVTAPVPPSGPAPGTPAGAAFEDTVAALQGRLSHAVRACLESGGAESIHALRVSGRRLRAVLQSYRKLPNKAESRRLQAGLKWLHGRFGAARELDVFRSGTLAPLIARKGKAADAEALAALAAEAEAARRAAVKRASRSLATARYLRLAQSLGRWSAGHWPRRADAPEDTPVEAIAARSLARAERRVWRAVKRAKGKSGGEAQHALRIEVKKLRYAVQMFQTAFPGPRADAYQRALARLQDGLGAVQDADSTVALARRLARGKGAKLAAAARLVAAAEERRRRKAQKRVAPLIAAFEAKKPFWG